MKLDMQVDSKELERAFRQAPAKVKSGVNDWVKRSAARTVRQARQNVPARSGALQSTILPNFGNMSAVVSTNKDYALFVHEGTGIYGPKKRPITPKSAKALRMNIGGSLVFSRSSKGQRKQPFMDDAYKNVKPEVDSDAVRTLERIVSSI